MPKQSGIDCLRTIQKVHGDVPTILMSGLPQTPSIAKQSAHVEFLAKPFSMGKLAELVQRMLSVHETNAA